MPSQLRFFDNIDLFVLCQTHSFYCSLFRRKFGQRVVELETVGFVWSLQVTPQVHKPSAQHAATLTVAKV